MRELTFSPVRTLRDQRGIIPIVGIAIFLGLIVLILIGVVVGLDGVYQEQTGRSMFPEEAGIHKIRAEIEEKKEKVRGMLGNESGESPEKAVQQTDRTVPLTSDERMSNLEKRLNVQPR